MTRTNKIILISVITIVLGYLTLDFLCKVGVKCKNCSTYSLSIEDSKKDNFFAATYKPLTDKVKLTYHNDTVEFITGWAENSWHVNSDICLLKRKEKGEGYNLIIEFKKYPSDTFNFQLDGYGVGWGMGQSSKTTTINQLYDTLTFQIVEKNPDNSIGWQEKLDGEQIRFLRVK
jgi:hypothetical protein